MIDLVRLPAYLLWTVVAAVDWALSLPGSALARVVGPSLLGVLQWAMAGGVLFWYLAARGKTLGRLGKLPDRFHLHWLLLVGALYLLGAGARSCAPVRVVQDELVGKHGRAEVRGTIRPSTGTGNLQVTLALEPRAMAEALASTRSDSGAFGGLLARLARSARDEAVRGLTARWGLTPQGSQLQWTTLLWTEGATSTLGLSSGSGEDVRITNSAGTLDLALDRKEYTAWQWVDGFLLDTFILTANACSTAGGGGAGFVFGGDGESSRCYTWVVRRDGQALLHEHTGGKARLLRQVQGPRLAGPGAETTLKLLVVKRVTTLVVDGQAVDVFTLDRPIGAGRVGVAWSSDQGPSRLRVRHLQILYPGLPVW